jgi:hypothetical protein
MFSKKPFLSEIGGRHQLFWQKKSKSYFNFDERSGYTYDFYTIKLEPYLRMKVDPQGGIPPDGKDVLQECTWPAWMDGG